MCAACGIANHIPDSGPDFGPAVGRPAGPGTATLTAAAGVSTATGAAPAPASRGGGMKFAALRNPDCRMYLFGTMLSMMADNIEHVISYWILYQKFQSPTLAGFAVLVHWTPFLLFSVYFGALADRYDCRKVIQLAHLMYMVVSAAWASLSCTDT